MTSGNKNVTAKTDIVELNGGERVVYFELNGFKCSAKVPLDYNFNENITYIGSFGIDISEDYINHLLLLMIYNQYYILYLYNLIFFVLS
mgnify:CR=1 FL=1